VQSIVTALVGKSSMEATPVVTNGSAASAAAPALSQVFTPPVHEESDETSEPSRLPDNATDQESLAFAQSHPVAKRVMRVFRAKIVEVKRA